MVSRPFHFPVTFHESVKKESTPVVKTTPLTVTKEAAKTTAATVVKTKKVEVKEIKTTPVTTSAKTVVKPVQSYQSAVTTAANNNYGTQWISTNTAPKAASTVLINFISLCNLPLLFLVNNVLLA